MPELPEVETVCRALAGPLRGRRVHSVSATVERLRTPVRLPALQRALPGRSIRRVFRRAKYIVLTLTRGEALLIHLGMTGHLRICPAREPWRPHDRVALGLSRKEELRLHDTRRFASVTLDALHPSTGQPASLAHLGTEPLAPTCTPAWLHTVTRGRKSPIKTLLMNQSVLVGVGNIYASEALWRAGIRPTRQARRLTQAQCADLVVALQAILREAIAFGGTTVINFATPAGTPGAFRDCLQVYGRHGEACTRCGESQTIRRTVQAGRSTFWCAGCQR